MLPFISENFPSELERLISLIFARDFVTPNFREFFQRILWPSTHGLDYIPGKF